MHRDMCLWSTTSGAVRKLVFTTCKKRSGRKPTATTIYMNHTTSG